MNRIKWFSTIRILGLFLVLTYHLFYNQLPGGFLGVDVFFTFSGYLITALIIAEVGKKGSFHLFRFYKRRFIRIFVPLFLSIAFTLPFMLLISPDFRAGIGRQVAAAIGFVTNYFEILSGGNYEAQLLPHLYIHTWSLSVEMHFYIFWGLVCAVAGILLNLIFSKQASKRLTVFRIFVFVSSVCLAAFSFFFMQKIYGAGDNISNVYFDTLSRLYPFFIGAAVAALWGTDTEKKKDEESASFVTKANPSKMVIIPLILVAVLSASGIFAMAKVMKFEDAAVWHYGFLTVSLLTAVLIFATRALHSVTPKNVKEPTLITAIADMSYNIYLFHWPLYIIFSDVIKNNTIAGLATIATSVLFSALVLYGVERLLKRPKSAKKRQNRKIIAIPVGTLILGFVVASGLIINKAPVITSIEIDFTSNQLQQDVTDLFYLRDGILLVDDMPVKYDGTKPLQANLLPKTEKKPDTPKPTNPSNSENPPAKVEKPDHIASGGVTIVGDSVPLGAQTTLKNTISDCYVDAKVSRSIDAGYQVMMDLQNSGELREYVVIALGTNGSNSYAKLLTKFIDSLEPGHKLIFVTPFDGRSNENAAAVTKTTDWVRNLPGQYPFVTVADWAKVISSQTNLLAGDKVHMGGQSAMNLYAQCVADAITAASGKPGK
ncbi:acyltransferase [Clostridia bacterium]|nr:acyltransferase [Clostridia bacterium]